MIALAVVVIAIGAAAGLVYLADVWEDRRRAERQHRALRSFYERGTP